MAVHRAWETNGAEFHPDLKQSKIDKIFSKGTENSDDGYSAYEAINENLSAYLRKKGVNKIYHCGLPTEYCVKKTAMDSLKNNFETYVVEDAIAAVHQIPQDAQNAITGMKQAGIKFIHSSQV